jgi:hypothetical protein
MLTYDTALAADRAAIAAGLSAAGIATRAVYEGFVSTRGQIPTNINTGAKEGNARRAMFAREDMSVARVLMANWYQISGSTTETGPGAPTTFAAAIEYPVGTFTTLTWNGGAGATGVVADKVLGRSDLTQLAVRIPRGAMFTVHTWYQNAVGCLYCPYASTALGDGSLTTNSQPGNNLTATGIAANGVVGWFPLAIVGPTNRVSALIFGDSRSEGASESTTTDEDPDVGCTARWLGPNYAYCNVSQGGAALGTIAGSVGYVGNSGANSVLRRSLLPYCSDAIVPLGINDFNSMFGLSTIVPAMKVVCDWATTLGKRPWICTVFPATTSSDSFATAGGQTPMGSAATPATAEANRVLFNQRARYGRLGINAGCIDLSRFLEDGWDTGKLPTTGVANATTTDGIHLLGGTYRQAAWQIEPIVRGQLGEYAANPPI